jgi:integrase
MASVSKRTRPTGGTFYQAIWWAEIGGKRKQQTKSFDRKRDADAFAQEMAMTVESKGIIDGEKHTTERFLTRWIATLEAKGEHSPTTLDGYQRAVGMLCSRVGDVLLGKLTPQHLDIAYADLLRAGGKSKAKGENPKVPRALSARTVLHVHRAAHTAFEQARKWKLIAENPAKDASPPTPKKAKVRGLSEAEILRVLEAADASMLMPRTYPGLDVAIELTLVTGVRRSELLGLAWDCVDFDKGEIEIKRTVIKGRDGVAFVREDTKSDDSARVIAVPAETMEKLGRHRAMILKMKLAFGKEYAAGPVLCFPDAGGIPRIPSTMSTAFRQVLRRAKVTGDIQPVHGFRHTQASMLVKRGVSLKAVSTRLGHSTTRITADLYVHSDGEQDRAASDIAGSLLSTTKIQQFPRKH